MSKVRDTGSRENDKRTCIFIHKAKKKKKSVEVEDKKGFVAFYLCYLL